MEHLPLIAIVGPTASGKTHRAVALAHALAPVSAEIISADSRQVYRGMDIGSGKDIAEYGDVPYHLIDIVPAGVKYNLYRYLRDYAEALDSIRCRNRQPILCGGTGMYVEAALNGLKLPEVPQNPELRRRLQGMSLAELAEILAEMKTMHNTSDVDTPARAIRAIEIQQYYIDYPELAPTQESAAGSGCSAVVIGVDIPRDTRRARIEERLRHRLEQEDMVGEVERLLQSGVDAETLIAYGLEYRFMTRHLLGELTYDEMSEQLLTAIRQFAKRQMTWFRGMERRTAPIHWLPWDLSDDDFCNRALQIIRSHHDA